MKGSAANSNEMNRREFGGLALGALVGIAFGQTLFSACGTNEAVAEATPRIVAPKAAPIVKHWAVEMHEICSDLRASAIPAKIWQEQVEKLFGRIDLPELLRFIVFQTLKKGMEFPERGVTTRPVKFPEIEGVPENTVFVKKIFGMKKGRAIVPHGHSNMASAHLILNGEFHLRHFEKIEERDNGLLIRPSIEKTVRPGDSSSISDERDNVHWFVANSDEAFTFDVIMLDLESEKYEIHNLDMEMAKPEADGTLFVPEIDVKTALKKYGKQHHRERVGL